MANSEIGEMYEELRKLGQEKRASNREASGEILKQNNIEFVSNNGGAHLVVKGNLGVIDFWPGTGKYIPRDGLNKKGRGVKNLLKLCR